MKPRRISVPLVVAACTMTMSLIFTPAAPAKHQKQTLRCNDLIKAETVKKEIAAETGIGPEITLSVEHRTDLPRIGSSPSSCYVYWTGGTEENGNITAYGYPDGYTPVPLLWNVFHDVSAAEFRHYRNTENTMSADLPSINAGYTSRSLKLGFGSQAFTAQVPIDSEKYPTTYGVYVRSKRGNVLEFYAWPLSEKATVGIVKQLLAKKKF